MPSVSNKGGCRFPIALWHAPTACDVKLTCVLSLYSALQEIKKTIISRCILKLSGSGQARNLVVFLFINLSSSLWALVLQAAITEVIIITRISFFAESLSCRLLSLNIGESLPRQTEVVFSETKQLCVSDLVQKINWPRLVCQHATEFTFIEIIDKVPTDNCFASQAKASFNVLNSGIFTY